jgi:hypothetical protein
MQKLHFKWQDLGRYSSNWACLLKTSQVKSFFNWTLPSLS